MPAAVTSLVAVQAKLVVCAFLTPPALVRWDFRATVCAGCAHHFLVGIMEVVQRHHCGMFCPPQRVKLQELALAKRQETCPCIKNVTVHQLILQGKPLAFSMVWYRALFPITLMCWLATT